MIDVLFVITLLLVGAEVLTVKALWYAQDGNRRLAAQCQAIARERDDLLGKLSDPDAARVARSREWPEYLEQ